MYNWQQTDWPYFTYSLRNAEADLKLFEEQTLHVSGILKALPENTRIETLIDTMVAEAIKTSAIEGEFYSREDVMSSIRNKLGLNQKREKVKDKNAEAIGQLMVEVRNTFTKPLTKKMLCNGMKY